MKRMTLWLGVFLALVLVVAGAVPVAGQTSRSGEPAGAPDWQVMQTEVAELNPSEELQIFFGYAVDVDGDTAIVGAANANVGHNIAQGSVYVYYRDLGGPAAWGQVVRLTASDGETDDRFGSSVSIDGDTAVVGAPGATVDGNEWQGAAYVFYRNQGGPDHWGQLAKLTVPAGSDTWLFGSSASLDGDTLFVGAPANKVGDNVEQGAAYVFSRNQGGADAWGQVAYLTATDGVAEDRFGRSASLDGNTAIVGAYFAGVGGNVKQGAAYVFYRNQGELDSWGQVAKLTAAQGGPEEYFGNSVSLDGDTAIVGAYGDKLGGDEELGSAYLFSRNQGGADAWGQVTKLALDSGVERIAFFGFSVSISGDTAVVGAMGLRIGGRQQQGAGFVYSRNVGGADAWGRVVRLTASDGDAGDALGFGVSVDRGTAILGAIGNTAAYVYALPALHLRSLDLAWEYATQPGTFRVSATVRVHNEHHARTGGVTVQGEWTLPDGSIRQKTALTNREGEAKFSLWVTHGGSYQFCVTDLVKTGYAYDPGANEVPACQSIAVGP